VLQHLDPVPSHPHRVLVVGAGGFVGAAIAGRLERDGVSVLRLGRREIDLLAPDADRRLSAVAKEGDALIAAAAMAPCRSPEMLRDNMTIALTIVQAAAAIPLSQVVNISSDAVYADSAEPLTEDSVTAPDTLHGTMHVAREAMFKSAIRAPLAILRPTLLYGAADTHDGYGPNRFRRLAARGEPIVLFGDGEERRDHVLIDDLAELVARIVYRRSTGILNIATGVVTSFLDVARMAIAASGKDVPIERTPRSGPMPHNGYRAFDIAQCRVAFSDFAYTPPAAGILKAAHEMRP
jgi:nucleoside-diphosphate-sugar epimerase